MKPKCLGKFARAKYDVRDEERSQRPVLRRAIAILRRNKPKKIVGRMKFEV